MSEQWQRTLLQRPDLLERMMPVGTMINYAAWMEAPGNP